jgi:hypothetical protein
MVMVSPRRRVRVDTELLSQGHSGRRHRRTGISEVCNGRTGHGDDRRDRGYALHPSPLSASCRPANNLLSLFAKHIHQATRCSILFLYGETTS